MFCAYSIIVHKTINSKATNNIFAVSLCKHWPCDSLSAKLLIFHQIANLGIKVFNFQHFRITKELPNEG